MSEASSSAIEDENTNGLRLTQTRDAGHGDASVNSETIREGKSMESQLVSNEELPINNTFEVLQCQVFPSQSFKHFHTGNVCSSVDMLKKPSDISEIPRHKDGGDADMQKAILVSEVGDAEEDYYGGSDFSNVDRSASGKLLEKTCDGAGPYGEICEVGMENVGDVVNKAISPHQKNYVVDYGDFRRKGYFLDDNENLSRTQKVRTELSSFELQSSKAFVIEWLSELPATPEYLGDSENDNIQDLDLSQTSTRYDMLSRFMTDEDHFKRLILKSSKNLKYSSNLEPVLSSTQLEVMLAGLNEKLNEHLDKLTKVPHSHHQYEYVSGTVGIPLNWEVSEDIQTKSYFESLITWIKIRSLFSKGKKLEESHDKDDFVLTQEVDMPDAVLKPYHGPVILHGATIEAGSTNVATTKSGVFGKIVEEVKAVLLIIHKTLRNDHPPPTSNPPLSEADQPPLQEEDPEIKRLTEKLLQVRSRTKSKSTLRTVFGYRKSANVRTRVSNASHRTNQRRGGFLRAVESWVNRKRNRGRGSNNLRNIGRRRNRVNPMIQNQQQNVPPPARNFPATLLANIMNCFRSCFSRILSFYGNTHGNEAEIQNRQNIANRYREPPSRIVKQRNYVQHYGNREAMQSRRRHRM
ncbi:unnamed protein product [Orchesella dallaii]|uniref:Uncharacterized protein n=1 Tax=Orchesella dallaii TaxID=48710 RepID=A0ABP1RNC9_9HEXA